MNCKKKYPKYNELIEAFGKINKKDVYTYAEVKYYYRMVTNIPNK